jgi:phage gp29-like protein
MFEFLSQLMPNTNKGGKTGFFGRSLTKRASSMGEVATRDKVDFSTILGYLPDPDEILTNTGETFPVYRKIMLDTQIRACINSRKAGTKSLLWDIDRGEETKSKESELIKEYYENALDIDEINDAILNAPLMGFQPIEIIWGRVGAYILPIELKAKNQEWFTFDKDNKMKLLTLNNMFMGEDLPERKFLIPTYNDIHNNFYNPYGDKLLSSCFWPASFKKTGFKWWVTFTEKYGMPYLVGKLPPGQESQRENMMNELKAMAQDAIAVISTDCEIEVQKTGDKSSSDIYNDLIEMCDAAIAKVILGQTLTTEGSSKGNGSQALGKVHSEVRDDIILSDKKIVENTHNQLIQWICEINFGTMEKYPKFEMYEEEDVDMDIANRDKILKDTGVKFTKKYFIKTYNLEEEDFEVTSPEEQQNPFLGGMKQTNNPLINKQLDKTKQPKVKEEPFSEYGELTEHYTDLILEQFSDEQLQEQIKGALQPIYRMVADADDYKELKFELGKLKPTMKTTEIEDQLTKVIFIAHLLGSKDVREETI